MFTVVYETSHAQRISIIVRDEASLGQMISDIQDIGGTIITVERKR